MIDTIITFCGQRAKVGCDGNCKKAWGMSLRPKEKVSEKEDDWVWFSDGELGDAPDDPGSTEGFQSKPKSSDEFPNKWCVRECERCEMSNPGEYMNKLELEDFSKRVYNIRRSSQ